MSGFLRVFPSPPCERRDDASDCASARRDESSSICRLLFDIVVRKGSHSNASAIGMRDSVRVRTGNSSCASNLQAAHFRGFFSRGLIEATNAMFVIV